MNNETKVYWRSIAGGVLLVIVGLLIAFLVQGDQVTESTSGPVSSQQVSLDAVLATWIRCSPACVSDSESARSNAAQRLRLVVEASGHPLTEAQAISVAREMNAMAERWGKYYGQEVKIEEWWITAQHKIYYYLCHAAIGPEDKAIRVQQHTELVGIMARLPWRMLNEWGAPVELEADVKEDCRHAMAQYELLLSSEFLRPSQVPLDSKDFVSLKERMGQELDRLGSSMAKKFRSNEEEWRASLQREKPMLPESFGADLLARQRLTYRQFITFFYGMAAREFLLPGMRKAKDRFPWGEPDSYGVSYRRDSGWVFWIRPRTGGNVQDKSGN